MLLRSGSTPALASFDTSSLISEARGNSSCSRRRISSLSAGTTGAGSQVVSPAASSSSSHGDAISGPHWRRVQSESDLAATAAVALFNFEQPRSRRTSLTRHTSLPAGRGSALDFFLDELQAPLPEESTLSGEGEDSCSISGRFGEIGDTIAISRELANHIQHENSEVCAMSIAGGSGVNCNGKGGQGGRGSDGGNHDPFRVDDYYRRLLAQDPGNSLLLRNYATYLHEIQHDLQKAEAFYERAILANPEDADLRSQYAKLIWEFRGDDERASSYFEQAVHASPDDCSVLGAYAAFLWDVDGEDHKQDHQQGHGINVGTVPVTAA